MEIKAELIKPYTDDERFNFIIEQNYNKGYKIEETEEALQAWGYSDEELAEKREIEFHKSFFPTSLGYIRRAVTMADGSHKDFLSDLLPVISIGLGQGQTVNILTYDEPPFDEDITDWTEYQHQVAVTPQFIQECFATLANDFLPINEDEVE